MRGLGSEDSDRQLSGQYLAGLGTEEYKTCRGAGDTICIKCAVMPQETNVIL